jgi:hypothetical protein
MITLYIFTTLLSNKIISTPININSNISYEGILKHRKYRCDSLASFFIYRDSWQGHCHDKKINTWPFPYHPGYHPSTHISPRLRLGMIPGMIWKRTCINLYPRSHVINIILRGMIKRWWYRYQSRQTNTIVMFFQYYICKFPLFSTKYMIKIDNIRFKYIEINTCAINIYGGRDDLVWQ